MPHKIVISTDGHCGADLWEYKSYLEQRYHDAFDPWAHSFHDAWADELDQERPVDNRSGVASAATSLNWDSQLRLDYIDSQGIAAEVLFPNTAPPFYPSGVFTSPAPRSREEYELRFAGLRAHNRWLADFCSEAPERRAGFAQVFLDDIDEAVAEVRWAKENGLRGVLLPGDHVLKMVNLYYPHYEPLWAACAELELPLHRYAGAPTESVYEGGEATQLVHFVEIQFYTSRAISHLIFSGVFERHPDLRFVTTEIARAAELARDLTKMDMMYKLRDMGAGTPFYPHVKDALGKLQRTPSEYFTTNCYVGGPHDLRATRDVGVPNLMWGGTSPMQRAPVRLQSKLSAPRSATSHRPSATSLWPAGPPRYISSISTSFVQWPTRSGLRSRNSSPRSRWSLFRSIQKRRVAQSSAPLPSRRRTHAR